MQSLLNIYEYYVDNIDVRVNYGYKESELKTGHINVDFDIKQNKERPLDFMISMLIELNKSDAAFASGEYRILLNVSGYFSFLEGTSEETVHKMIAPSGLSILYGIARGVVAQVTGNCKYGKYILPSLNFIEIIKKKYDKSVKDKTLLTRKKKKAA